MANWTIEKYGEWLADQVRVCEESCNGEQRNRSLAYQNALDILRLNCTNSHPAPPAESLHEAAKRYGKVMGLPEDNGLICTIARIDEADAIIDGLRKWAAENPPKAAKAGVCTTCANDRVACGNCKHNPDAVDHYARRKGAPTPPNDGKLACNTCKYEDHDSDETPCVDCIHNDGEDEHYDPAQEPPKATKTYREDFFEKFPNAPKGKEGFKEYPTANIYDIYQMCKEKEHELFLASDDRFAWNKPLGYWEAP